MARSRPQAWSRVALGGLWPPLNTHLLGLEIHAIGDEIELFSGYVLFNRSGRKVDEWRALNWRCWGSALATSHGFRLMG